jgi:hypothetical protein
MVCFFVNITCESDDNITITERDIYVRRVFDTHAEEIHFDDDLNFLVGLHPVSFKVWKKNINRTNCLLKITFAFHKLIDLHTFVTYSLEQKSTGTKNTS